MEMHEITNYQSSVGSLIKGFNRLNLELPIKQDSLPFNPKGLRESHLNLENPEACSQESLCQHKLTPVLSILNSDLVYGLLELKEY